MKIYLLEEKTFDWFRKVFPSTCVIAEAFFGFQWLISFFLVSQILGIVWKECQWLIVKRLRNVSEESFPQEKLEADQAI